MEDTEKLLPKRVKELPEPVSLFPRKGLRIRFPIFAQVTVGLPLVAFVYCVYRSTVFNFRESTATHCQVDNYLPSVSAAIGSFSPQKYIWIGAIVTHFYPRIAISRLYQKYFESVLEPRSLTLISYARFLNMTEIWCLLGLTLVSSTDFYPFHAFSFVTFVFASIAFMMLSCYLLNGRRVITASKQEMLSLRLKFYLMTATIFGFLSASYCFYRHNAYCEAGVYSLFAISEYVVVLSNMGFHMTAYLDFRNKSVYFTSSKPFIAFS